MKTQGTLLNQHFAEIKAALFRANEALAATLEAKNIYLSTLKRWNQTRDEYLKKLAESK